MSEDILVHADDSIYIVRIVLTGLPKSDREAMLFEFICASQAILEAVYGY